MSDERFYTRIKRGMIFWYNIDASVDKFDVPELRISEKKTARDYMEYGDRPWLLVSVDERNIQGKTCTIVPLCTGVSADKDRFHVPIRYKGKDALILCEHLRTVNCIELIKYDCTLEESTMKMVENALRDYLGIHDDPLAGLASSEIIKRLESTINEIVKKKVAEERAAITQVVDVDDAVLRISEGLENMFDVKKDVKQKEDLKKEESEPLTEEVNTESLLQSDTKTLIIKESEKKKSSKPRKDIGMKRIRHVWDKSTAIGFIQEVDVLGVDEVALKYGYADGNSVRKTISYLNGRFSLKK